MEMAENTASPLIEILGEAMLRLSPSQNVPLRAATELELHVAGTKLNVFVRRGSRSGLVRSLANSVASK